MKRALFLRVLGLGIGLMGCATDVDDPLPPAPAAEVQSEPPKQALGTRLRDPEQQLLIGAQLDEGLRRVPVEKKLPTPIPIPE